MAFLVTSATVVPGQASVGSKSFDHRPCRFGSGPAVSTGRFGADSAVWEGVGRCGAGTRPCRVVHADDAELAVARRPVPSDLSRLTPLTAPNGGGGSEVTATPAS